MHLLGQGRKLHNLGHICMKLRFLNVWPHQLKCTRTVMPTEMVRRNILCTCMNRLVNNEVLELRLAIPHYYVVCMYVGR